ncbi:MAG: hypothetical protein MZV70_39840 [Desulfobacterales bacterium]|nr:hypothetical protein [Desulfobacterales bacterium]
MPRGNCGRQMLLTVPTGRCRSSAFAQPAGIDYLDRARGRTFPADRDRRVKPPAVRHLRVRYQPISAAVW